MLDTVDAALARVRADAEIEVTIGPGATSLEFLQAVYRSADQPMHRRMRAAIAALPFEHPKLAVTATVNTEGFAAKLEAMRARSAKVIDYRPGEAIPRNCTVMKETDCP